jgi:hypothetical protein
MKLLMMKMMTMTATLCTEELFLSTHYTYLALPVYQMINHVGWGGYGQPTQYIWHAQLGLTPPSQTSLGLQSLR